MPGAHEQGAARFRAAPGPVTGQGYLTPATCIESLTSMKIGLL